MIYNAIRCKMYFAFYYYRYVSRVSINGKDISAMNNMASNNEYRSSTLPQSSAHMRYPPNNWKNSSEASSGASTGASPTNSSNEDPNCDERFEIRF